MTEAIEEVIFPAISLIFLLLGIVLLGSILFSAFNPYDQIAFANAEKMRAAIDQACVTNNPVYLKDIQVRQNVPPDWANVLFTILPRWLIKTSGDPNYIIYYESFPPGEGVGWEVYHPFQNRLVVNLPEKIDNEDVNGMSGLKVEDYVKDVIDKYKERNPGGVVDAVVINNILLSEGFRSDFILKTAGSAQGAGDFSAGGPTQQATRESQKFLGYGEWDGQDPNTKLPKPGGDYFRFSNYLGLANLEKTLIKYQTCGENSLCLKTRNGVYAFPLQYCEDIKNVEMIYDARANIFARDAIEIGALAALAASGAEAGLVLSGLGKLGKGGTVLITTIGRVAAFPFKGPLKLVAKTGTITLGVGATGVTGAYIVSWAAGYWLSFKTSDLAISSPCVLEGGDALDERIKIERIACNHFKEDADFDYAPCTNVISYPIYQYNAESGRLQTAQGANNQLATHYSCVEKVDYDALDEPELITYGANDKCVQITIPERAKGFCWTPDLTNGEWETLGTLAAVKLLHLTPISDSTHYIRSNQATGDILVLTPSSEEKINVFENLWEGAIGFRWPGGFGA